jgi:hypothetical protein
MTTFDYRKKVFDKIFTHDREMLFKARAWRNLDLATWAAQLINKSTDEVGAYREQILNLGLCDGEDDAVLHHILQDLHAAGQAVDESQLRLHSNKLMIEALKAIKAA